MVSPELVTARVVKYEVTVDSKKQNPRLRCILAISPLSLPGFQGVTYQRAKTFSLVDTTSYRAGSKVAFKYQLVPQAQQTPWRTTYEWYGVPATPYEGDLLPEITLSEVQQARTN